MKKLLNWIDEHGMFATALFLLIFIPLYPKIPLFEAIPGYLVRVRLEDLFIGVIGVFWLIQTLRKKISVPWPMFILMASYAVIGLISLLVAVFLQQTIPSQMLHIGKSALHYFRYLEYFSLFFFMYSGVKSKKHVKIALASLVLSVALISIYGFGQKYLEWPVYSTMNREASKGIAQTLDPYARVHSTFGGHYDLAAYLVITLPIILVLILFVKNKSTSWRIRIISSLVFLSGTALLLLSASKMAFLAFLVAAALVILSKFVNCFGLKKSLRYIFALGALGVVALGLFLMSFGGKYKEKLISKITDSEVTSVQSSQFDETWSENTHKYGLSMGIRLDTLWPQALYGFSINPWTGKGYATLNKLGLGEFTESDSTDNNYLRNLGEIGFLGSLLFFYILYYLFSNIKKSKSQDNLVNILKLGYLASFFGLLINALVIDVFAASKVAFSFWAISGLVLKATRLENNKKSILEDKKIIKNYLIKFKKHWLILLALIIFILFFHKRPFSEYSPVQSFSNNQSAAIYVRSATCLSKNLFACQDLLSRVPIYKLPYIIYLIPFYLIFSHPSMYYFANLLLAIFIILIIYNFSNKKLFASAALLALVIFAFNNNLTKIILNNFRDSYDTHQYRAVRRMNILADNLVEPDLDPVILTYLNPDFINLYKKSEFKILEFQDNLEINNFEQLYFSNAAKNIQDKAEVNNILNLSKNYALSLESIDCEQRCNIFRVLAEKLELVSQPIAANQKAFAQKDNHKIILSTNKIARFSNPKQNSISKINLYKSLLNNLNADGFIFVGTSLDKAEVNHGEYFKQNFINSLNIPVIYAISDHSSDLNEYGSASQRFVLNNKLFLLLDDNLEDSKDAQKKLFFDTLLQLYQHPEIKDIIIISNSLDWTEQLTNKDRAVAAQYSNNLEINWHIFGSTSSIGKSPEESLSFIQRDYYYENTYFAEEPVNRVWTLDLDKDEVSVESKFLIEKL